MTMTFNAKEAAKTASAVREAQQERARKAAENHFIHMVEPQIRAAAEHGENQVDIKFHNSVIAMYEIINALLCENGFETSFDCERTCLHIKW